MIEFTVYGQPQPAGSKRAFAIRKASGTPTGQVVVTDDNPRSRSWKQEVRSKAAEAMRDAAIEERGGFDPSPDFLAGPLYLVLRFYLRRPQGHYGTGRNAEVVKPSAPERPIVKPDLTKLVRAVEDAMTGIVWRDDASVVAQMVTKHYGAPERVEVEVGSVGPERESA